MLLPLNPKLLSEDEGTYAYVMSLLKNIRDTTWETKTCESCKEIERVLTRNYEEGKKQYVSKAFDYSTGLPLE